MLRAILIAMACVAAASGQPPQAGSRLAVVQTVLHDRQESAPQIPPGYKYVAGELMYLSFRIGGYQVKNDKVDLRWQLVATDPEGLLLWEPLSGAVREEVTHNDESWLPKVEQSLALPPQLFPGKYKLKIRIADELAQVATEKEIEFDVGGRALPAVDKLTILNAAFYRSEDDRHPMDPVVYKPGDSVFVRFELAGFRLGEKNRYDVEYGIRVLRPSGKVLYEEPKAAAESESPYYPKRLMLGGLSINLTPDLTPGEYTMAITAKDNTGQQTASESVKFSVLK